MGHANISTTLDRYEHLLPGSEAEAAGLLDGYLSSQRECGRGAGASRRDWRIFWRIADGGILKKACPSRYAYPIRSRTGISWIWGGCRWSQRMPFGRA